MNRIFTLACILLPYIAQSKPTGITIPTFYPHFGSSEPNVNSMGPTPVRLVSKVKTIYDGTKYIPFDSARYTYSNGRGGILDLDYTDKFLSFDNGTYYDYDKTTGSYVNNLKYTQTFHPNNKIEYQVMAQWIAGIADWNNVTRYAYTYDASRTRLERTDLARWNGSWLGNSDKFVLVYNTKNDIITIQENLSTTSFDYDANHNVTGRTEYAYIQGHGWDYTDRYDFTYDGADNLTSYVYQKYINGSWTNALKKDYIYAGNNVASTIEYAWKNNSWQQVRQNLFSYDGNNNRLSDASQVWDEAANSFVNMRKEEWTYNAQNQPLTYKSLTWNTTGQNWQAVTNDFLYRYEYEFYNPTSVNHLAKADEVFTVYPQPATDVVNISLKNSSNARYQGSIYDIKGQMIKNFEVSTDKNQVPLNDIPAGNYVISLSSKGQKIAQPLVVAR